MLKWYKLEFWNQIAKQNTNKNAKKKKTNAQNIILFKNVTTTQIQITHVKKWAI